MPIITTLCTRAPRRRAPRASPTELLDDLAGRRFRRAHRAGRAERARKRAARLRRQPDRAAVAVPHRDGLDRVAVGGAQAQLDRAVGGDLLGLDDELAQRCPFVERHTERTRQRRDLVPALGVLGERGATRLRHAVRGLVALGEQCGCGVDVHAGSVRARLSELPNRRSGRDRPAATGRAAATRSERLAADDRGGPAGEVGGAVRGGDH